MGGLLRHEHDQVVTGPDARGPQHFAYDADTGDVTQTIVDPDDFLEWKATGKVDFDASRSQGHAVVEFTGVGPSPPNLTEPCATHLCVSVGPGSDHHVMVSAVRRSVVDSPL